MSHSVQPLESLFDQAQGQALPEPPELLVPYGPLQFPLHPDKPSPIGNFVSTLYGMVSLNIPGQAGGGPISGGSPHDHLVMGLLRVVADAVIVGAGTLRAVSQEHRWTADYIYPALALAAVTIVLRTPSVQLEARACPCSSLVIRFVLSFLMYTFLRDKRGSGDHELVSIAPARRRRGKES